MTDPQVIETLEAEWSPDGGFFWELREGRFAASGFERALAKLRAITIEEEAVLPRRLVSLLWYIPLFMQWQVERMREGNGDLTAYTHAATLMENEIARLLGVP
ncbi:MAG: hypothetical protein NT062_33020 [Proteobacteria bacterium]|nr:hypothetical protein [Pseudomonadota bacterium]